MATKISPRDKARGINLDDLQPTGNQDSQDQDASSTALPVARVLPEAKPVGSMSTTNSAVTPAASPMTAPAALMARANQEREAALKQWEGAEPTRFLDPRKVHPSDLANRHEDSFKVQKFLDLKSQIAAAGENIVPIKVRRRKGLQDEYEIIFGHRRHRACLELGIPVKATISELDDDMQLFVEMEQENRDREDLRPYELGVFYVKGLDKQLFFSVKQMASKINMDPSNLAKAIALARLPSEVLSAFQSPLDLQFQWAIPLTTVLKEREEAVLATCAEFAAMDPKPKPKAIFDKIVMAGMSSQLQALTQPKILEGKGGRGEISLKGKKIIISLSGIDEKRMVDLETVIQTFLQ